MPRQIRLFAGRTLALILLVPLLPLACGSDTPAATPTPKPTARPPLAQTSPETDREMLVALYNATNGPNWDQNENWLRDQPVGRWYGVTTDGNGRVIFLDLPKNRLSGEMPPELGNLANLAILNLRENRLSGEIPPELGNLAKLVGLDLVDNDLSGEIPPELGRLANLTGLYVTGNGLSGCIPASLRGQLEDLSHLGLPFC